ncbi:MAG: glutamate--tRNA ligase [Clostridia bacterium]|nr:glutamate--tRNA ligase [Clostridia bacterium]
MDYLKLAELLFPHIDKTADYYEEKYPPRDLPEGARVTRIAPSPTGYLHIGALYGAVTDERSAHLTNGVFYLRIEDTDSKREVSGAADLFITMFEKYGLKFDEGAVRNGDNGKYGPYRQSERTEIYQTFAKKLVAEGKAYPCFCTDEEIEQIRKKQEAAGENPGYYGKWAVWRDAELDTVEKALAEGKPFVIRLRSQGDSTKKIKITDAIKGDLEFPKNNQDFIILKSDGTPPYHFAHAIDDHLMRTTHVVRGEEWLATLPWHVELFSALGFKRPVYCHTANIMKLDNGSKRKISKRKDPEADVAMFLREGYPQDGLIEYVLTLLNSNFEDWRRMNPKADRNEFPFSFKKMGVSGPLFDFEKLYDICKDVISRMDAETVYKNAAEWMKEYDPEFYAIFTKDPDYAKNILSIGRGGNKPRKDFGLWKEIKDYMGFFYEELFTPEYVFPENLQKEDIAAVLEKYPSVYNENDDQQQWFEKLKGIAESVGFAADTKEYKKNPDAYKGHVGDIAMIIRVAITGKQVSPDTYAVIRILGTDEMKRRIYECLKVIKKP